MAAERVCTCNQLINLHTHCNISAALPGASNHCKDLELLRAAASICWQALNVHDAYAHAQANLLLSCLLKTQQICPVNQHVMHWSNQTL